MRLIQSLNAWGSPQFNETLKQELQTLPVEALPLQQGLAKGSYVLDEPRSVMVIATSTNVQTIRAHIGIFYSSLLGGCSCADDPTPVEAMSEYCEVSIEINRETGDARATLVAA